MLVKGDGTFGEQQAIQSFGGSVSVAAGDLNEDGNPDIIASDGALLPGNGDGTFGPPSLLINPCRELELLDWNGDHRTDILQIDIPYCSVILWENRGAGFFLDRGIPVSAGCAETATLGDFNRDGLPDLGAAVGASVVAVASGPFGTYNEKTRFSGVRDVRDVSSGDLDGDGREDLVFVGSEPSFTVSYGNGDGSFGHVRDIGGFGRAVDVTTGDVDGDSDEDLVVADAQTNSIKVLLGGGDGSFPVVNTYNIGGAPSGVLMADFNDDNLPDLVAANLGLGAASVLINSGGGAFGVRRDYQVDESPPNVATGDFDGDGVTDIALPRPTHSDIALLIGNGDGTFKPPRSTQ